MKEGADDVRKRYSGNGKFVKVTDVTERFPIDETKVMAALAAASFGEPEQELIRYLLHTRYSKIINNTAYAVYTLAATKPDTSKENPTMTQNITENLESYVDYCKNHAITELEGLKGCDRSIYISELGMELTSAINCDGTATYSTWKAKEYIKEWFDEAGEVYQYQKDNYGECWHNPFERPEAFHVCMIIEGVNALLSQCPTIEKYWNDDNIFSKRLINSIIKELKELNTITL